MWEEKKKAGHKQVKTEGQIEGRSVREKEDYRRMKKTWNKGEKTE